MIHKRNIFTFLFSLFVLLSANGMGSSVPTNQTQQLHQNKITAGISQSNGSKDDECIISMEGVLPASVKVNENQGLSFRNFKNSKKIFNLSVHLVLSVFSKPCYTCYCCSRVNRINVSPFYIAYRSLII